MSQNLILLPVCAQVLLTFIVAVTMAVRRQRALKAGTRFKDIALGQDVWPEDATKAANNFRNQFETPVLFYVACAFAMLTRSVDVLFLALAWVWVASRAIHAFIHLGGNDVGKRAMIYGIGMLILMVMWVLLLLRGGLGI